MKAVLATSLVIAAILAWYCLRPATADVVASGIASASRESSDPSETATSEPESEPSAAPKQAAHVREITQAERAELERQIAHARSMHASRPPALPPVLDADDMDSLKTTLRAAMKETIPYIAKCYEDALPTLASPNLTVKSRMELTGDPDIGTLIDAQPLVDGEGAPLPAHLDDCLRTALQSLELPPLTEGDHVVVDYPFTFRAQ
jgi:hypothetical protein